MKSINKLLKLGSLFDGSGTCPLAATICGIEPVWASEIEKFPIEVTTKRFPNMKHLGDITKINGAEIESVDIITFGSPCTNLSVAGKQNGFNITFECFGEGDDLKEAHFIETTRATDKTKYLYEMDCPVCGKNLTQTNESALFFNAIRIIQEMREATNNEYPRYIMWENVPGAFSSNKGSDFKQVLEEISETEVPMPEGGKWSTSGMVELPERQLAWRVLDAQHWGVPQRRKRIFLVTDFRGQSAGKILFKSESLLRNFEESGEAREGVATDSEKCTGASGTDYLSGWDNQEKRIFTDKGVSPTLSGSDGGGGRTGVGYVFPINTQIATRHNVLGERTGLGIGKDGDPAFTLQEAHSHGVAAFMAGQGAKAGSIGYQEEVSSTLKSVLSGGNTVPSVLLFEPRSQDGVPRIHKDIVPTLNTAQGGQRQPCIVENKSIHQNADGEVRESDVAYTINTNSNPSGRNAPLVYSFDSLGSNSMKSKNPHSGCNVVEVAKTIDTSSQDPSKNQGGIAVVNTAYGFCPDNSITAGGVTCEEEKTATLSTTKRMGVAFACNQRDEVRDLVDCAGALQAQPGMKQQTFCLQGNMIGRDDKNGPQGDGINEEVAFTLNSTDRHAVSYTPSSFAQYQEGVGTLKASGGDLGGGSESLITFAIQRSDEYKHSDVSHTLAARDYKDSTDLILPTNKSVRRLTPTECARLQGFPDWWCADIPHSDTAEYKMWGNGMALPCVLYIMQNIADIYKESNTTYSVSEQK